ncbi:hypothetical protein PROFUN_10661 [Planoprotostelium fungivorum]|uniref:Uncharacterized protein n=1 Tax=Planoprotostelium fungivorum TaxID=1890364 RepID=A0A2P6MUW6_9EUKA|nr:hypothetical protein PROFUN_10661 [Planoprotostelium fungivorum]
MILEGITKGMVASVAKDLRRPFHYPTASHLWIIVATQDAVCIAWLIMLDSHIIQEKPHYPRVTSSNCVQNLRTHCNG